MKNIIVNFENIKFKPMEIDRILLSIDRLTRFKFPEDKYLRVFKDIITGYLIYPKYKKSELDLMDYSDLTHLAEYIINKSLVSPNIINHDINNLLYEYEKSVFYLSGEIEKLLNNSINYSEILKFINENSPNNLKWLKELAFSSNPEQTSLKKGFHFPIKKVVICEGITEEILLPVFADLLGFNFDRNGVHTISAGGKNQVVKLYYELADKLKLPVFILLDNDAEENGNEIQLKLKSKDTLYIIEQGEFEDILPVKLIEKALKYSIQNISESPMEHYDKSVNAVKYLEEFYKTRGAHEFKKAEFAQTVKENIFGINDVSEELKKIICKIKIM